MMSKRAKNFLVAIMLSGTLWNGCAARQPGDPIEAGFNVYSPQQDIELGREAAAQIRRQVDVVENRELQNYVARLGGRLASQPGTGNYPYSFTLINDDSINAFALPGGPIFLHSGLFDAADSEAQLAGVIAHEISHVALRHATSQASKANLVQIPAVLAGAAIGQESVLAQLGQLGLGLGLNSVLMKYSRDAEREADALGTRIMARAGYNPLAMAQFFEKLQEQGGARAPEFLSSHPNPGNRIEAVQAEVQTLPQREYSAGTRQFPRMKQLVAQLPPPQRPTRTAMASTPPAVNQPAGFQTLETNAVNLSYPGGWEVYGDRRSAVITIAPGQGLVRNQRGGVSLGYGTVLSYYRSQMGQLHLQRTTEELISELRSVNRDLRVRGRQRRVRVDGSPGLLTTLSGSSPYGGQETNVLLTVARPEGLFYMVFVVPQGQFNQAEAIFDQMLRSIRFRS